MRRHTQKKLSVMPRTTHKLHALSATSKAALQGLFEVTLNSVRDSGEQSMDSAVGREVWAYLLNWYHHDDAWEYVDPHRFRVSGQYNGDRVFPSLEVYFVRPFNENRVGWGVITRKDVERSNMSQETRDHNARAHALRKLVDDQVEEFRVAHAATRPCDDAHVDHIYEFLYLTRDWATQVMGLANVDQVPIRRIAAGGAELANPDHARSWQDYHRQHATLRWLPPRENCSSPPPSLAK